MTKSAQTIQELHHMISLRNHLYILMNGPRTAMISKFEERTLRSFANSLDREVVDRSLQMAMIECEPAEAPVVSMHLGDLGGGEAVEPVAAAKKVVKAKGKIKRLSE